MRLTKNLLFGAAASFFSVTGVWAADLPVKSKPIEYVKICSLYGAGFYYIPGTDTCIRIGGQIRGEISLSGRGNADETFLVGDGNSTKTRDKDIYFTRARVYFNIDTRTATNFGTLRTFSSIRSQFGTPVGTASGVAALNVDSGIIQWAGFTIGRANSSYFDNPWVFGFKWGDNGAFGWSDSSAGRFVAAYTHQFGNGISVSLSLEDNKDQKRGNYNGDNPLSILGVAPTVNTRGGNTWPEIIGQLRIEQAWGGFHLSGNLINNHVAYNCGPPANVTLANCTEFAGNRSDRVGGGVHAALKINVPTGFNDAVYLGASYAKGATSDVFRNNGAGSGFGIYSGSSSPAAYGGLFGGYVWDTVYTTTARTGAGLTVGPTGQQLTTAYGGTIAFEHGWNPEWRTSVFGGIEVLDYNTTANAILCSRFGAGSASGTLTAGVGGANISNTPGCNFDIRVAGAGTRTYWTPVKDLTIGFELQWANLHAKHASGTVYNLPVNSAYKPSAPYLLRDQNQLSGLFSVRRAF